jgi:hypothetical protein
MTVFSHLRASLIMPDKGDSVEMLTGGLQKARLAQDLATLWGEEKNLMPIQPNGGGTRGSRTGD